MKFDNPLDFLKFLQSPESDLLWTDTEEILAMCNKYQMSVTVVKVSDKIDDQPTIVKVTPDPDIHELGLPNTTNVGPGKVPTMFMLLQGAHYDLAVAAEDITGKFSNLDGSKNDEDGYKAEEEEVNPNQIDPMTNDERLRFLEVKYAKLKEEMIKIKQENRSLKSQLKEKKEKDQSSSDQESETYDFQTWLKPKVKVLERQTLKPRRKQIISVPFASLPL